MKPTTKAPNAPRVRWSETTIAVGAVGRRGYTTPSVAGLAVTHNPESNFWSVTHIASGHAVGPRCYSRKSAQFVLLAFAPLTDWTQGKDALWTDPSLCLRAMELKHDLANSGTYPYVPSMPPDEMPAEVRALAASRAEVTR